MKKHTPQWKTGGKNPLGITRTSGRKSVSTRFKMSVAHRPPPKISLPKVTCLEESK